MNIEPAKIYLHLETINGAHTLVDQDGRSVAGVRGLSLDMAYDDVSEYVLRGILCRSDCVTDDGRHWQHINRGRPCLPVA